MAIVIPNVGEVTALSYLVGKTASTEDLDIFLFATNITPSETDTFATYTVADGGGYANKTLTGASWTVTGGAPTSATYAQQTWTFTGALTTNATIYGYGYKRSSSGDLVGAEATTNFTPAVNGDFVKITPAITGE